MTRAEVLSIQVGRAQDYGEHGASSVRAASAWMAAMAACS
jgi:hypothetical protein